MILHLSTIINGFLLQQEDPPIDDLFEVDPNAEVVKGAAPVLAIVVSLGLAALLIVGVMLLLFGVIAFFTSGDNPGKRKSGGVRALMGIGAIVMSVHGWQVLGNVISDSLNGL